MLVYIRLMDADGWNTDHVSMVTEASTDYDCVTLKNNASHGSSSFTDSCIATTSMRNISIGCRERCAMLNSNKIIRKTQKNRKVYR